MDVATVSMTTREYLGKPLSERFVFIVRYSLVGSMSAVWLLCRCAGLSVCLCGLCLCADRHGLVLYLSDAAARFASLQSERPNLRALDFLGHYFHDVCTRTHVLFREYSFVSATAYNRASFLHNFWKCYKNILKEMEFLSTWDLHSLVQLLCTDFPRHLVLDAARITFPGQVNDYLVPFADFLYAFQLQFYFNEFLQVVAKIYERSARGGKPCRTDEQCQLGARSITPASENASWMEQQQVGFSATEPESPVMSGANEGPCGILGGHLLQQLLNLDNHHISCPPGSVLHDILSKIDRITFDNFLITLSKHDGINNHIGVLPNKLLVRSISTAS
uniref:Centriolar satellite-associated tubulin polyglutamylase complex regulator 1 n=1 Tax=Eptatretus burgeri TaxID=7764 RepID=A0A8C4NBL5_EPTBU